MVIEMCDPESFGGDTLQSISVSCPVKFLRDTVCMNGQHFQQSMDKQGMVTNPTRDQLNGEK